MKSSYDNDKKVYIVEMSLEELDIIGRLLRWSAHKYREREYHSVIGGDVNEKCRLEAEKREKMCNFIMERR